MNSVNIMIVGVGGQGTLLASRIIGTVAIRAGYDVKVSEVHGMSQRGGSVVTYVKLGEKIYSPVIEPGEADIILAFEQLEALRWSQYLKPSGTFIINTQKIDPMPVIMGSSEYPGNIIERIQNAWKNIITLDALDIAKKCGNMKVVNVVMIGVLARQNSIPKDIWIEAIKENVRREFLDVNLKAFEAGYEISFE